MLKETGQNRVIVKLILTGMLLVLGIFLINGCGTLQTLLQNDGTSTLGGWIGNAKNDVPVVTPVTDSITVSLFFPDATGRYLTKEERTIPKTAGIGRETVSEWAKGPVNKGALAAVPTTTVLLDIGIKEGVATVDFSKEFLQYSPKVTPEVVLYGLTNTLTQFSTVKEVKVRVEGKPLSKLGNVDASRLVAKPGLVKGAVTIPQASTSSGGTGGASQTVPTAGQTGPNYPGSAGTISPSSINLFSLSPGVT